MMETGSSLPKGLAKGLMSVHVDASCFSSAYFREAPSLVLDPPHPSGSVGSVPWLVQEAPGPPLPCFLDVSSPFTLPCLPRESVSQGSNTRAAVCSKGQGESCLAREKLANLASVLQSSGTDMLATEDFMMSKFWSF